MTISALKTATGSPAAGGVFPGASGARRLTKLDSKKYLPNSLKSLPTTDIITSTIHRVSRDINPETDKPYQTLKYKRELYPKQLLSFSQYQNRLYVSAQKHVVQMRGDHAAERVLRSIEQMCSCGATTLVKHCDCGTPIPATAKRTSVKYPCNNRVCPACARARSTKLLVWAKEIFAKVKEIKAQTANDSREYRMITLTCAYNKGLESVVSVKGFRERTAEFKKVWAGVWESLQERYGKEQGAFRNIECEGHGFVHMHVLHWGSYIDLNWLQAEVNARFGHTRCSVDIEGLYVKGPDGRKLRPAVTENEKIAASIECFKYTIKLPGNKNGKWQAGGPQYVMHPDLMVRWLIASHRQRLGERYGVFRQVRRPDSITNEEIELITESAEYDCHCPACGNTESKLWRPVKWPSGSWVNYAVSIGVQPYPDLTERILNYGTGHKHGPERSSETLIRVEREKRKRLGEQRRRDKSSAEHDERTEARRAEKARPKARIEKHTETGRSAATAQGTLWDY